MKEAYPEDNIMLCFVQGFGNGSENSCDKTYEYNKDNVTAGNNNLRPSKKNQQAKRVSLQEVSTKSEISYPLEEVPVRSRALFTGKSIRLSSGDRFHNLPEVNRSFSDRFSITSDAGGKRSSKGFLTIRKTWSTGNFVSGAAGGGCGAARSAPATPLQLDPHPRSAKHDKHTVKPLSGSAPSVRVAALGTAAGDTTEGSKPPGKSRQKKFQRHFPQVGPEEKVLNYYSCALVGDLLLQGHLYITKNYFAFYSNVFGYVTKLLIPTTAVLRITKEKVARIIPNAVAVCTRDERHVFGSLLSRDSTYKLMMHVWKAARASELDTPKPQELRSSEVELDASEYSPEDDSSSGGPDQVDVAHADAVRPREADAIISAAGAAVIQPALLTGAGGGGGGGAGAGAGAARARWWRGALLACVLVLACSAAVLAHRLHHLHHRDQEQLAKLSGDELYSELLRWRARLHGRAASELHAFLTTNLLLLTKVRQSLEALSGVILTDMAQDGQPGNIDLPNQTVFS